METWTLQAGFPLVTVTRNYLDGSITLSQKKFLEQNRSDDTIWYIPVNYKRSHENTITKMWFVQRDIHLKDFTRPGSSEWILFNVDGRGKYFNRKKT